LETDRVDEVQRTRSSSSSFGCTDTSSFDSVTSDRHEIPQASESLFRDHSQMSDVMCFPNPSERFVYQVQFKFGFRDYTTQPGASIRINMGSFVIVKCEFGEDIGVITEIHPMTTYIANCAKNKQGGYDANDSSVGIIAGIASLKQRQFLPIKLKKEAKAMKTVLRLVHEVYNFPMKILGVEYQADGHKLSIHYISDAHVDFREVVKDLFALYRVRIWMKKCNHNSIFIPKKFAVLSLTTGTSVEDNIEQYM